MIAYQDVSLQLGDREILQNVTIQIEKGEFFVLVGPSGSGKTTTLKCLNRLIEHSQGEIFLEGKRVETYPLRDLRLQMGYVLQEIALFPNLTVAENIALIPQMKRMDKQTVAKRTEELLEKVGLDPAHYLHRLPRDLSGGERQRVGILRALIAHPKVLLMDEPFSALDPLSRQQLQELTQTLHREYEMTTVFVTHDMEEAMLLADRICLMREGQVVQIGRPEEFRQHPADDFVREFFQLEGAR